MTWVRCKDCGTHFERAADEAWKTRCIPCFKKSKRAESDSDDSVWMRRATTAERELSSVRLELYQARQAVEALLSKRPASSVERELAENWRALVQLVHPDKHNGSQGATRVSQWLNSVKGRLPCD